MKATIATQNELMPALTKAIGAHRFVLDMKPEHLEALANVAMFKQFESGEMIFHAGESANRFYLICDGKIALESQGSDEPASLVQFVGEGEVLGWSWLFPPYYWHYSARAVEPTNAIFFYGTRLRQHCEEDPAFGYDLMKRVAAIVINRLQISRVQLLQLQQESSRRA
jgi:CRP/FNR family transcriptional regulator, cyclic AMP receptor protein